MVPNSRPVSQIASAQPATTASVWSGWASVAKSRSSPSRPSKASRTEPPTRCSSCPAALEPAAELVGDGRDAQQFSEGLALRGRQIGRALAVLGGAAGTRGPRCRWQARCGGAIDFGHRGASLSSGPEAVVRESPVKPRSELPAGPRREREERAPASPAVASKRPTSREQPSTVASKRRSARTRRSRDRLMVPAMTGTARRLRSGPRRHRGAACVCRQRQYPRLPRGTA